MPNIGLPEIALLAGVIVLIFGAKKLPEVARSLGQARNEYKKGLKESKEEAEPPKEDAEKKSS